jgi:hypothetical protein
MCSPAPLFFLFFFSFWRVGPGVIFYLQTSLCLAYAFWTKTKIQISRPIVPVFLPPPPRKILYKYPCISRIKSSQNPNKFCPQAGQFRSRAATTIGASEAQGRRQTEPPLPLISILRPSPLYYESPHLVVFRFRAPEPPHVAVGVPPESEFSIRSSPSIWEGGDLAKGTFVIAARNWTPSSTSLAQSTAKTSSSSTTRVTLVVARTVPLDVDRLVKSDQLLNRSVRARTLSDRSVCC